VGASENGLGKFANNQNSFNLLSMRELKIAGHLMNGESVSKLSGNLNLHACTGAAR
jgi:hypothetical protein